MNLTNLYFLAKPIGYWKFTIFVNCFSIIKFTLHSVQKLAGVDHCIYVSFWGSGSLCIMKFTIFLLFSKAYRL